MKPILILPIVFILISGCSFSQTSVTEKKAFKQDSVTQECSKHYLFENEVIDLDELKSVPIGGKVIDFKKCSKYAHRFNDIINDTVYDANGIRFRIENNKEKKKYNLYIQQTKNEEKLVKLPVASPLPEVHEYSIFMFPHNEFVIVVLRDFYGTHYTISKYDADGTLQMKKEIEHTYIEHPEPKTNHYKPYLEFHSLTKSQMIFTSHMAFADKLVTRILDLKTFEIQDYNNIAHGVILDENEEHVLGIVTTNSNYASDDKTSFEITMIDRSTYFFEINKNLDEACEFILKDSLLYIGNYHPISTGSALLCIDLRSGKLKWTADVLQVMAAHSEYWNKVTLSMYKDKIIMQGDEAYGSYLQIFDAETGKRLAYFGNVFESKN